jgi:hypothetical protein
MSSSFRILTLGGFLLVTTLGFSSAHAAIFVNRALNNNTASNCLTGFNSSNGTPVVAYPCTASVFQVWNWEGIEIEGLGTTNLARKCLALEVAERRTERSSKCSIATGPAHRSGPTRFLVRSSIRSLASASTSKRTTPASPR